MLFIGDILPPIEYGILVLPSVLILPCICFLRFPHQRPDDSKIWDAIAHTHTHIVMHRFFGVGLGGFKKILFLHVL